MEERWGLFRHPHRLDCARPLVSAQLPKLCSLDVSFNRLSSLQNLHTAKELRELKIYNNKLTATLGLKAYG